jgi:hypothetical protein
MIRSWENCRILVAFGFKKLPLANDDGHNKKVYDLIGSKRSWRWNIADHNDMCLVYKRFSANNTTKMGLEVLPISVSA